MVIDTKFRRENSNFKIKYTDGVYIPDPNSENPTEPIQGLLQILPKNLGPEDFMGMIASREDTVAPGVKLERWAVILTVLNTGKGLQLYAPAFNTVISQAEQISWVISGGTDLVYLPETGYLVDDKYGTSDGEGGEGGDDKGSGGKA